MVKVFYAESNHFKVFGVDDSYKPSQKKDFGQTSRGAKLQPAEILRYFEELKRGTNKEIGPKDFFEIASTRMTQSGGIGSSHPYRK